MFKKEAQAAFMLLVLLFLFRQFLQPAFQNLF